MKKKITYLLGAGASFGTVPIVEQIPDRLRDFAMRLKQRPPDKSLEATLKDFHTKCRRLATSASGSNTIDTYALQLHKLGPDENFDLASLKHIISIFFAYTQFMNPVHARTLQLFTRLIDYVKPNNENNIEFNFITWNYDFQLEFAINKALRLNEINPKKIINTINVKSNGLPESSLLKISTPFIHLNGIAGIAKQNGNPNLIDLFRQEYTEEMSSTCAYFHQQFQRNEICSTDVFKFNFENVDYSSSLYSEAIRAMTTANELIVIGYSFPRDNNRFDSLWTKSMNGVEKITIQDPRPNMERIKELFSSRILNYRSQVNEFYIPDFVEYA